MNNFLIRLEVDPKDVAFITKIFEGYDGLALATTIDGKKGLMQLNFTPATKKDVLEILDNLPKDIRFIQENPIP